MNHNDKGIPDELTISVFKRSDGEFEYNIHFCSPDEIAGTDPEDGGVCTSNMKNAIDMAGEQAKDMITFREKQARNALRRIRWHASRKRETGREK